MEGAATARWPPAWELVVFHISYTISSTAVVLYQYHAVASRNSYEYMYQPQRESLRDSPGPRRAARGPGARDPRPARACAHVFSLRALHVQ